MAATAALRPPPDGNSTLTSLQKVQMRLEEDRRRAQMLASAGMGARGAHGGAVGSGGPFQKTSSGSVAAARAISSEDRDDPGAGRVTGTAATTGSTTDGAPVAVSLPAGGAASAAALLRLMSNGRASADEAGTPAGVVPPRCDTPVFPEDAVAHPPGEPPLDTAGSTGRFASVPVPPLGARSLPPAPRRPHSGGGLQAASLVRGESGTPLAVAAAASTPGRGGASADPYDLDVVNFGSDREHFREILHFLRDGGEGWQPPRDRHRCESLRKEALYFGCPQLVNRLDEHISTLS